MRQVDHSFFVRAAPSRVFRALTRPEELARWMVDRADLVLRKGAKYELEFQGGWIHQGTVLGVQPGRRISLAWAWKGVELDGTVLTLTVSRRRNGSVVRMVHSGFPATEEWVDLYGVTEWGWTYYGMNLKSVLETGHDLRSDLDG